jgi:ParB-like chromosome segregation protein Spo0J
MPTYIMQIQDTELKKLKPWEKNPRINDHAVDAVIKSIKEFGFNVPILCDPDFKSLLDMQDGRRRKN